MNTIEDQSVVEGNPIDNITIVPDNEDATIEVTDLPEGLEYDPETGMITGTPTVDNWGQTEEERDLPITIVVTNPDGSTVTQEVIITVQRDTDNDKGMVEEHPDKENNQGTNANNPNTGDDTSIAFFVILLFGAGIAWILLLVRKRRNLNQY